MSLIRKPYDRERVTANLNTEGGADQAAADSVNINNIMAQFSATGQIPHVARSTPLYGDFTQAVDLHTQMNRVEDARAAYAALPAKIREASEHDPVRFLEMVQDEEGSKVLTDAGLHIFEPTTPESEDLVDMGAAPISTKSESPPLKPDLAD